MDKQPSIFWPLQILISVMGLSLGWQLFQLNAQRVVYEQAFQRMIPEYQAAVQVEQKLRSLAQDLLTTSAQSTGASQIVKEFGIEVSKPDEKGKST